MPEKRNSNYDFDLFVMGAGSGGVRAARMSAGYGARVATAEDKYLGGTCVNLGCIPKKLFVYAAQFAEDFAQAQGFGWGRATPDFTWHRLLANKNTEITRLNGVYKNLLTAAGVTHFDARARILDEHHLEVQGKRVSTEKILIATGGWPLVPEFPGSEHVITSNEAFFLEALPRRCLVVGGGYIAVEFAGIFQGLGVATCLSYRGELLLRRFDIDVRKAVGDELERKGIDLRFNSQVRQIDRNQDGSLAVQFEDGTSLTRDLVLYATGRVPAVADIGLENVPVKCRDNGAIITDEEHRSSQPNIFALGDVTDRIQLTPVAIAEAMCFASTQFNAERRIMDYEQIATAVFCQPNIGTVGLTEAEARADYDDVALYLAQFKPLKHSLSGSEEKCLMKLIVDQKTDRILGIHMVGAEAGEIIQGLAIAMKAGATKSIFDATVGIHPTQAEEFVTLREAVDG